MKVNLKDTAFDRILFFQGLSGEEMAECREKLRFIERDYKRGELILRAGEKTHRMGIVLSGSVTIESNDVWGNCTILSHVDRYGFFAETYAMLSDEVLLVDVRANADSRILFIDLTPLKQSDVRGSEWQYKLMRNLLTISTHKNLTLSGRSFHTAPHTIRGRVLSYLNSVSLKEQAKEFRIPFDRQQMADYLNVERTALSKELGKMKKEGLIDYHKNQFRLL